MYKILDELNKHPFEGGQRNSQNLAKEVKFENKTAKTFFFSGFVQL